MMKTMLGGCGISERVCQSDPCVADGDRRTDGGKQVRPTIKLRRTEYAQSSPDEIANDAQSPRQRGEEAPQRREFLSPAMSHGRYRGAQNANETSAVTAADSPNTRLIIRRYPPDSK